MSDRHTLLPHINPSLLDYDEWLQAGMAIHSDGGSIEEWADWSKADPRFPGIQRLQTHWQSFRGDGITLATLGGLAKKQGYKPKHNAKPDRAYGWDDVITFGPERLMEYADHAPVEQTGTWNPADDLRRYIRALFANEDYVSYVLQANAIKQADGSVKHTPSVGTFNRTAGEMLEALEAYDGDIEKALGSHDAAIGGWIRFNPMDGAGVRDSNVAAYKYALIECDKEEIEKQRGTYEAMELPIIALVHSGNKSLHAIVKVEAADRTEYRERVEYLYAACARVGLVLDTQNKNPSRLSRMPGLERAGQRQYLVAVNIGKPSWSEWKNHWEEQDDNLPEIEPVSKFWDNLPPLAPPLIDGILRRGHKMLLSGPSKAGKSFLLLQLAIAIAEGRDWLGWPITGAGRVLYINLELDRPSCLRRIADVYAAREWEPEHLANLDVWHLRGQAVPLDELAPKLIRRALKQHYAAVIIDPIYKVLTGDESAADDMARFCNQFDRICLKLESAVIYCHHHSKGDQAGKRSRDRSSGSGVFARDPDAILDLLELTIDDDRRKAITNHFRCAALESVMASISDCWQDAISEDDRLASDKFAALARSTAPRHEEDINAALRRANLAGEMATGWRIETTLREFAPRKPENVFFAYPLHHSDSDGLLQDAPADGEISWKGKRKPKAEIAAQTATAPTIDAAYAGRVKFDPETPVTVAMIAQDTGKTPDDVHSKLKKSSSLFCYPDGRITEKLAAENHACTLHEQGKGISEISKVLGVSRVTLNKWGIKK